MNLRYLTIFLSCISIASCGQSSDEMIEAKNESSLKVIKVNVSGQQDQYSFAVELKSPDTGCEQYADWWEVISEEGHLIHRRNLGHSHVNEQPFTRSGSPVKISSTETVIVRGHMNNLGYGVMAMIGSVENGFEEVTLDEDFAKELESVDPQPPTCAF